MKGRYLRDGQTEKEVERDMERETQTKVGMGVERRGRGGQMGRKDQGAGTGQVRVSSSQVRAVHECCQL